MNAIKMDTIISNKVSMNIVASIPWGNSPDQIDPSINEAPYFGYVSEEQKRKTYTGVLIRADKNGGCHVMKQYMNFSVTDENEIPVIHFSPDGKFVAKTKLPRNEKQIAETKVFDYAVDAKNNTYLLEGITLEDGSYNNRLVKINVKGEIVWETRGEYSETSLDYSILQGSFTKLLHSDDRGLFLVPAAPLGHHSIAQIDTETGKTTNEYSLNEGNDNCIYINDNSKIARAFFVPAKNELFYGFNDMTSKTEKDIPDTSRFFGDMKGFDNNENVYTYTWYNGFRKLSTDGSVTRELLIRDVVVRNDDKSIYTNWVSSDSIFVTRYKSSGETIKYSLKIPVSASKPTTYDNYRLVHVDAKGSFYFHTGEAPGNAGKVLVISEKGEIEKEMLPPFDLFAIESTFHFTNIHIDTKGSIYLPVTDPEGIKIVKLTF